MKQQTKVKEIKAPKLRDLKTALSGIVNASISNRIVAMGEALKWYDAALPSLLRVHALTPEDQKVYDRSVKTRDLAADASNGGNMSEAEVALMRTLACYEKIWAPVFTSKWSLDLPKHSDFYTEYNAKRAQLEASAAQLQAKYQAVIDLLNKAYLPVGFSFSAVPSVTPRQFDGADKIYLGDQHVAQLADLLKREGAVSVVFTEALYVSKLSGVVSTANGPAIDFKTMASKLPLIFEGMRNALVTSAPGRRSASSGTNAGPKAPKAAANLVLGLFRQGTSLADGYELLKDGKFHTWEEIAQVAHTKYPKDVPYYLNTKTKLNFNRSKHGCTLV